MSAMMMWNHTPWAGYLGRQLSGPAQACSSLPTYYPCPGSQQYCWICLDEVEDERGPLIAPCDCAKMAGRVCHSRCVADLL